MKSCTVVLGNSNKEDVLGVEISQLKHHRGNKLFLHESLYAPAMRCFLVSFVSLMNLGFIFCFCLDGSNILYGGNVFGQAT